MKDQPIAELHPFGIKNGPPDKPNYDPTGAGHQPEADGCRTLGSCYQAQEDIKRMRDQFETNCQRARSFARQPISIEGA
jgi:hypothetical protein